MSDRAYIEHCKGCSEKYDEVQPPELQLVGSTVYCYSNTNGDVVRLTPTGGGEGPFLRCDEHSCRLSLAGRQRYNRSASVTSA